MTEVESFKDANDALRAMTLKLKRLMDSREKGDFNIALSGGGTAREMFALWAGEFASALPWRAARFFWVDERCVPPSSDESNFRFANELFFGPAGISPSRIFRIRGEDDPHAEAERYSAETAALAGKPGARLPDFDCTILGMGSDGHTASIFPDDLTPLVYRSAYAAVKSPHDGRMRVTMTGPAILNSHEIFVPVVGAGKAKILGKALGEVKSGRITLPSSYILRNAAHAEIFTDAQCPAQSAEER